MNRNDGAVGDARKRANEFEQALDQTRTEYREALDRLASDEGHGARKRAAEFDADAWEAMVVGAIDGLSNYIRTIDGKHEMGAGELAERIIRGWLPPSRLARAYAEATR